MTKRVLFLTGTRADFGKLKPLIRGVHESPDFDYGIFVTGMHVLSRYGFTVEEIHNAGFRNIFSFMNQVRGEPMDMTLANTIHGLSRYVSETPPDMLVVHGDRVEALAGAITGALNNIRVAHIEGGEVSGTIDELIRHAVSKLSHAHFVANDAAAQLLRQMGESDDSIFVMGSPDIDVMLSSDLPTFDEARSRYGIPFDRYAIAMLHPVTSELDDMPAQAEAFVSAMKESGLRFIVVYPNNDAGSDAIFRAYRGLEEDSRFRVFPSIRFEHFLTLLKHASFIAGNSSAGIREAPVYSVPTVNVGSRQLGRFVGPSIINTAPNRDSILAAMQVAAALPALPSCTHFGDGSSASRFMGALRSERLWGLPTQKQFSQVPRIESSAV